MSKELPPCGLYRTTAAIAGVEAGRLVYFHNHGNPGPGIYFPEKWNQNRAQFSPNGVTMPENFDPALLKPLPADGFYRVTREFYCCAKQCVKFSPDVFVQLGYNGQGKALVFVPQLGVGGIALPERGTIIDDDALVNLAPLLVSESKQQDLSLPRGIVVH